MNAYSLLLTLSLLLRSVSPIGKVFFFNRQKICFLPAQVFIYGQFSILFYDLCHILPSSYLCFHLFNFDVLSADYGCGIYYLTIHLLMLHVSRHVYIYSMHFDILAQFDLKCVYLFPCFSNFLLFHSFSISIPICRSTYTCHTYDAIIFCGY